MPPLGSKALEEKQNNSPYQWSRLTYAMGVTAPQRLGEVRRIGKKIRGAGKRKG